MKRRILTIVSAVILLAMSFAGCKHNGNSPQSDHSNRDYSGDVEIVKGIFDKIRVDDAHGQMTYFVSFTQKYSLKSKSNSEFESDRYSMTYEGDGTVALSFDAKDSDIVSMDFFDPEVVGKDLLMKGAGYLTGFQHENYSYKNEYTDKTAGGKTRTEEAKKDDVRTFEIAVDDKYFYASSTTESHDADHPETDIKDEFSGKIEKAGFIDPLPDELVNDAISRFLYMDAWPYIRMVTQYSNELLDGIDFSDAGTTYAFFEKNDIRAEETEDSVNISFMMDASAHMARLLPDPVPGSSMRFKGTMKFNKTTGELTEYEYDLTELLAAILDAGKGNKTEFSAKADEFTVIGKNVVSTEDKVNVVLDDIVNKEYEEYGSTSREGFMNDFVEHLLPSGK